MQRELGPDADRLTGVHGDKTVVPKDWTFKDQSVADNFDAHVREQLPWYDMATMLVTHFGRHYLPEGGLMYDLGASTGNITRSLSKEIAARKVTAISVDYSEEMAKVWRGVGEFVTADVRDVEIQPYDFGVAFLLLMFLPPRDQKTFMSELLAKLQPGGCLIVFDKVEATMGYMGTVMHRLTIAGKISSGVPPEEIVKKEMALAGQQRPVPETFFQFIGAPTTQVFRYGEFGGWAITR